MAETKEEKKISKETKETSISQKAKLQEIRDSELQEAYVKIQKLCAEYECGLDAEVLITGQGITPRIKLVDLQK